MNIPKKDVVSFLLRERLQGMNARSQRELAEILNKRLKKSNPGFAISGARARIIALNTPGIKSRIHTRKGRLPKKCPACSHNLKKTYTKNLKGRRLLLRLSCTKCPYRGSEGNWIPKRYEFWAS